jgi:hypothetical protein
MDRTTIITFISKTGKKKSAKDVIKEAGDFFRSLVSEDVNSKVAFKEAKMLLTGGKEKQVHVTYHVSYGTSLQ